MYINFYYFDNYQIHCYLTVARDKKQQQDNNASNKSIFGVMERTSETTVLLFLLFYIQTLILNNIEYTLGT